MTRRLSLLIALCLAFSLPVRAAEFETWRAPDGTTVWYAYALPADYDPEKAYPVLLAMPPGSQAPSTVIEAMKAYWEPEGVRRGYIVISPAAPFGQMFYRGGEKYVPGFLAAMAELYNVDGKFHLSGVSSGGLSAFRIALEHPELFQSMTVLPGIPPLQREFNEMVRLKGLRVSMYVGARDDQWRERSQRAAEELDLLGVDIHYEVVPNEGHIITTLMFENAGLMFDRMEGRQ